MTDHGEVLDIWLPEVYLADVLTYLLELSAELPTVTAQPSRHAVVHVHVLPEVGRVDRGEEAQLSWS
jgi:hypothetical protein